MISLLQGDCRAVLPTLPDASVHCVVTSPPYWGLRDYGVDGQLGLEPDFNAYVANMVGVFREVRRVLRDDGTCWINLGDSYASGGRGGGADGSKQQTNIGSLLGAKIAPDGLKPKDLCGIPWRVAFALQADGWYLRQDIIWAKPNPMPESVTDRCTKAHEYLFLLSKHERYYYDAEAIAEASIYPDDNRKSRQIPEDYIDRAVNGSIATINPNGARTYPTRNKRSVWEVTTAPFSEAHFATFPPALIEPCIKAGCPVDGTVLDPFGGAGTTGLVADRLQRNAILIELNLTYAAMSENRITGDAPLFAEVTNGTRSAGPPAELRSRL